MKKFFKLFGCTRARTKQLSSVELLKDNDMNSQKFDKSFHDKNKNNCFHIKIKSENIYTIPEMSIDNKDNKDIYGFNLNDDIEYDELLLSNDSPLICSYEKNTIKFSKKGLIELFNELIILDDWKNYWKKEDITIDIRVKGSPINKEFYLIKTLYTLKKSELKYNKSIEIFIKFIYGNKIRPVWDSLLKNLEIIDGEIYKNYIINTWAKSPIFLISERDSVEKRFIFKHNDITYIFSTSVPSNIFPQRKNVDRIINYINFFKIYEDDENYYFFSMNQSDFKMKIPQIILNITLPMTIKDWYNNLKNACNNYNIIDNKIEVINNKDEN